MIRKVSSLGKDDYIKSVIDSVDSDLTQEQARTYLESLVSCGAITSKEGRIVMATVSDRALAKVTPEGRSIVRADVFRNALLILMME